MELQPSSIVLRNFFTSSEDCRLKPLSLTRTVLGFAAAALVPGLVVGFLIFEFVSHVETRGSLENVFGGWVLPWSRNAILGCTLPVTVVFGVPLVLLCRRLGWERWWAFAIGGAALGVTASFILSVAWDIGGDMLLGGLPVAFCGVLATLALWSLWGFLYLPKAALKVIAFCLAGFFLLLGTLVHGVLN